MANLSILYLDNPEKSWRKLTLIERSGDDYFLNVVVIFFILLLHDTQTHFSSWFMLLNPPDNLILTLITEVACQQQSLLYIYCSGV